jgi:hypothetical protein
MRVIENKEGQSNKENQKCKKKNKMNLFFNQINDSWVNHLLVILLMMVYQK